MQIALELRELHTVVEALEAYLDAVYRSGSDVEYKHAKGAEIWRLRERLRKAMVGVVDAGGWGGYVDAAGG